MEPRPSRPNRPASSAGRTQRAAWVPPEGADDLTAPRTAETFPSASGSQSGGPWYGPHGSLGPEPPEYRAIKPPMPIKPRGERGNKWLRYLLAALLLTLVVGGSAFAITWFFGDDDNDNTNEQNTQALVTATSDPAAQTPAVTQTPQTMAEPTATSANAAPTATNPPAPTPTPPAAAEEGASNDNSQQAQTAGGAENSASNRDSASYLPSVADLDGIWAVQAEGDRPAADVAAALGDGGEGKLVEFGWQENLYRDFNREAAPDETFFVSVSVHRFDSPAGASQALTYFSDVLASVGIYQTAPSVDIGDAAIALEGVQDGYNLYALYVQAGNYMIRFGGSSQTGDPAPYVNAVADFVVAPE